MKKFCSLALLLLLPLSFAFAVEIDLLPDSVKVFDVEEVFVIANPKTGTKLRQQPASSSLISGDEVEKQQIHSLKNISSVVPNLFIPDYGSRITSAIYIRGVGSRINTPSVGLYVDNVPYLDKSAFDFNFYDIQRIDVLRGPQGTLYGRNTMGGLIKVYTKNPFQSQGTTINLRAATYDTYQASITHNQKLTNQLALSAGGFYHSNGGFFTNTYLNKQVDAAKTGGGRFRLLWNPSTALKVDFTTNYEYSDEGGYPYAAYNKTTGTLAPISYNDESSYLRSLLNNSLNIEYKGTTATLSAVTSFQLLNDRMFLDQDFTKENIFNLTQKQKQHTFTEELILKSTKPTSYQWLFGAFGFYQALDIKSPVLFKEGGIQMLQNEMAGSPMTILDKTMLVPSDFDSPSMGAALFHQSTYRAPFLPALSATIGLRLDYEKLDLSYNSSATMNMQMNTPPRPPVNITSSSSLIGDLSTNYTQLLPKFALTYELNQQNNLYASVTKGYRSGGYNIQLFSDLVRSDLRKKITPEEIQETVTYKPEQSWNYEVGSHLTLLDKTLWLDLSAFYMDTKDQQIACFVTSGLGRMMKNVGKSKSQGGEFSLKYAATKVLNLFGNYGFTHATFTAYNDGEDDFSGNYVPMVPRHTFSLGGDFTVRTDPNSLFQSVNFSTQYSGAGRIYWTERNDISQALYGTLNFRIAAQSKHLTIALWSKNALDKSYNTFYYEMMGQSFLQQGKPTHLGVDVSIKL